MEKTVASGLEDLDLKQSEVFKSWKELSSQASSVLAFTLQWDDLQNHFDSTRRTLQAGLQSLSEREKAVASREEAVEARESRFEAEFSSTKNRLESMEKLIEGRGVYLQSLESSIQEHREGLDAEERKLASVRNSVAEKNEEFECLKNSVEWLEREISVLKLRVKRKSKAAQSIQETLRAYRDNIELENRTFQALRSSIEDRKKEAELKVAQLRALQVSLNKDIKSKEEKLNTIDSAIVRRSIELELKEKQLECVQSEVKSNEEIVASLKNTIEECSNELEILQREAKRREDSFFSMKKSVEQCAQEFELKEKKMEGLLKKLEATDTLCEVKIKEAHLIRNKVNSCLEVVETRDKEIETLRKSLNACLSEVEAREINVESLRKSLEEHACRLQTEERLLRERVSELELRQECSSSQKSTGVRPVQVKIESLEQAHTNTSMVPITKEGLYMQYLLNVQLQKHDSVCNEAYDILQASSNPAEFVLGAMEGFYPSQSSVEAKEFDVRIVRRSCILLLEKLTEVAPQITSQAKDLALKLANDWISQSKLAGIDYLEALGIVQLINSYGLASEVNSNDFCRLLDAVGQRGLPSQLRQAVSDKASENLLTDLSTSFLNDPLSVVCVKIQNFLRTSPDPASHVLDFVESYLSQDWRIGYLVIGTKFMTHYVSLFEQLLKISPLVQPRVRDYAMKIAADWNEKIQTSVTSWEVLAFLQFLHTYRLFSSYDNVAILSMLEMISQNDEVLRKCKALSFAEAIPGFIQKLVQRKKLVDSVNLIYAFNLTDKFSPISLLRNYLTYMTDPSNNKRLKEKTIEEQEKITDEEIAALENVRNCVIKHAPALSKISADEISDHIAYLWRRKHALSPTCKKRGHSAISHQPESDCRKNKLPQKARSSCSPSSVSHVEVPFDITYDTAFPSSDAPS